MRSDGLRVLVRNSNVKVNYLSFWRTRSFPILIVAAGLLALTVFNLPLTSLPEPAIKKFPDFQVYGSGFLSNAVYPTTVNHTRISGLRLYGCWLGKPGVAKVTTTWMNIEHEISILVAGYPQTDGALFIELLDPDGNISQLPSRFQNAGESWALYTISLPRNSRFTQFRITASGGTGGFRGWFGFSEPFKLRTNWRGWTSQVDDLVRLTLLGFLAVVLYYAPGLLFRYALKSVVPWEQLSVIAPIVGFLFMASLGLLIWLFSGCVRPRSMAAWTVGLAVVGLAFFFWKIPIGCQTSQIERRAFLIVGLAVLATCAKATYSLGPVDELYGNTISRTLEVGDRSDSRVPWGVIELISNRAGPKSDLSKAYFSPWSFSSRGPLAGMAAAPIVLASGGRVSPGRPTQTWRPFDAEGFATYRVAMVVMGASTFLVFFWAANFLIEGWGTFALLCAALTPFLLHELYFTWPKMQASAFTLIAAFLLARRRSLLAGLSTGIGYMVHPLVLMSAPALAGILLMVHLAETRNDRESVSAGPTLRIIKHGLIYSLGFVFWIVLWRLVNWNNYFQTGFLNYFVLADAARARDFGTWYASRLSSLASTLIPLYVFLEKSSNYAVNSVFGSSSTIVHFCFQYWTTAPFGLGILAYPGLVLLVVYFAYRHKYQFAFFILLPLLFMLAYMGITTTGLLREGLHAWVFFVLYAAVVGFREWPARNSVLTRVVCFVLTLRALDIIIMFVSSAMVTNRRVISPVYPVNDVCTLILMTGATIWLSVKLFRTTPTRDQVPTDVPSNDHVYSQ